MKPHPNATTWPDISILFPLDGRAPYIWNSGSKPPTPNEVREKVDEVRATGRKRVLLWARPKHIAERHSVSGVLWVKLRRNTGPGFDAYKIGWVHIDKLEETLLTYIGLMQ